MRYSPPHVQAAPGLRDHRAALRFGSQLSPDLSLEGDCEGCELQDKAYWSAFNAIEHFGVQPDNESAQEAKAALDEARVKGVSKTRQLILQTYFQDLQHCFQDDREACKKANTDMNDAIRAPR